VTPFRDPNEGGARPTQTALPTDQGARVPGRRTLLLPALLAGVLLAHVAVGAVRSEAAGDSAAGPPVDPTPAATEGARPAEPLTAEGRQVLLEAYAPVVLLSPDERALPTHVEWYLARSWLERPARTAVVQASLGQARLPRLRPERSARGGSPDPADWTVYGHAYRAADGGVLLQYWFFYAYNYFLGFCDHDADWEHVTVRLGPAGRPAGAWFARHDANAPGVWVDWPRIRKEGFHPVVLSARGSHASYASPREARWPENLCPTAGIDDAPRRGCQVWRTWLGSTGGIVDLGSRHEPGARFLLWPGRWGTNGGITDPVGGPPGPAFQPGWCTGGASDCS
jgi:hypothetical protein